MEVLALTSTARKEDIEPLKQFLDARVRQYNRRSFVEGDPISVPWQYTRRQDREIAAFFTAVFSWGNRTTIIRKSEELLEMMDRAPYSFCKDPSPSGLKRLGSFKHRTFNSTDLLYFVEFLRHHYSIHNTLETAFTRELGPSDLHVGQGLIGFHHYFFSLPHVPDRTRKHVSSPAKKSTCKRLNMFLRWMVRKDAMGVDFGIWDSISPSQLICPVDLHVARVARRLGLLERKQNDWLAAMELTDRLRMLDPLDPVKYDLALFGMGIFEHY